jgi:hypothetical protein
MDILHLNSLCDFDRLMMKGMEKRCLMTTS